MVMDQITYNQLFTYINGFLYWAIKPRRSVKIGSRAGYISNKGYNIIKINGKLTCAHRIIWIMFNGDIPDSFIIDHIDGNPANNVLSNLRLATMRTNQHNRNAHRNGRLVGTSLDKKCNRWKARIFINGKEKYLGMFSTELEAHNAFKSALENKDEIK